MGSPSERERCGLGALLPAACRGRAESFARRLHSRLTSLGSDGGVAGAGAAANEASWLGARAQPEGAPHHRRPPPPPITLTQPRLSEADQYLEFGLLESPPTEECDETDFYKLVNEDNLNEYHCTKPKENRLTNGHYPSNDSDSDVYYDTDDLLEDRLHNGDETSSDISRSLDSLSTKSTSSSTQDFATTSDCLPSLTDEPPSCNGHLSFIEKMPPALTVKENSSPPLPETNGFPETHEEMTTNGCLEETHLDPTRSNGYRDITEKSGCPEPPQEDCETCNRYNENLTNGDDEIYVSNLNNDKDLTVECPMVENDITEEVEIELKSNEEEDGEERVPRVRRCSSLKTGKTPPGTPGRKKIVRFADVLGLDLADVRTFLDEIPRVPNSAYEDLKDADLADAAAAAALVPNGVGVGHAQYHCPRPEKILVPLFQQPGGKADFLDVVREQQVCLENAAVVDPVLFTIKGMVRVRNLDFHKSVHVRYTLDAWRTFADVQATYVDGSCDGFSDKFVFTVYAHTLAVGQKIEFACRFSSRGCQYWDNNKGANYCFQCLPQSSSPSYAPIVTGRGLDDHWGADFYYGEPAAAVGGGGAPCLSAAVQDYVAASLDVRKAAGGRRTKPSPTKQDILTVFVIVIFPFLFMFLQKVIYTATVK